MRVLHPVLRRLIGARPNRSYFGFFRPVSNAGLPASELAVAETFGFSCFGFLASLLPRLPCLSFFIVVPFQDVWGDVAAGEG